MPSVSLLRLQAPAAAAFESDAACFSAQEWENLEEWQRELYKNMLRGKNESLISLGKYRCFGQLPALPDSLRSGDFFPRLGSRFVETRRSRCPLLRAVQSAAPVTSSPTVSSACWVWALAAGTSMSWPAPCSARCQHSLQAPSLGILPCWGGVGCQRRKPPSPGGLCRGLSVLPGIVADGARFGSAAECVPPRGRSGHFDAAQKP